MERGFACVVSRVALSVPWDEAGRGGARRLLWHGTQLRTDGRPLNIYEPTRTARMHYVCVYYTVHLIVAPFCGKTNFESWSRLEKNCRYSIRASMAHQGFAFSRKGQPIFGLPNRIQKVRAIPHHQSRLTPKQQQQRGRAVEDWELLSWEILVVRYTLHLNISEGENMFNWNLIGMVA